MKRILIVTGVGLALLIGLPWLGFELWLRQQPSETRIAIEAFTPLEFLAVVRDEFLPRPIEDTAGFGRRAVPGRGHAPWVMRSSLDGRPRMLSLALAPNLWLAYSTETASIHQFWQGELDFTGPAFDARHGREPMSFGRAFLQPPQRTAWRVREGDAWQPAGVRWQAYGVDPATQRAWLRFELSDSGGRTRVVTERPEQRLAPRGQGLERIFELSTGEGPDVAFVLGPGSGELETDARLEETEGLLVLTAGSTRLVQWFAEPRLEIDRERAPALDEDAFAEHDCLTCHNERDRVVGPAWSEIAHRYGGADTSVSETRLATRMMEGGVGHWGSVPMPPHPDLSRMQAIALARLVLATEPVEALQAEHAVGSPSVPTTYDHETEPRPAMLHPSLSVSAIDPPGFTPQVGGLAWAPDGRLLVATWDRDGAVFAVENWAGPAAATRVTRIAEGLHEPLGIAVVDDAIYVIQKQEVTRLLDHDGDDWIDEYRNVANDWDASSNFHEFGFGLVPLGRHLYGTLSVCVLRGGKSCRDQLADRGKVFRVSLDSGEVELIASGFRTPNGVAATPEGQLLVTDNQGDWLPASKLMRVEVGDDYGWRAPGERPDPAQVTPPALWLPQNEVGNSPTQPVVLRSGPYKGFVLFGDIFNGGIKRGFLEEVEGTLQGAALHFSGGLRAPVNRLVEAPDGSLVAGQIGSRGNWGESGKPWFGLEVLRFADEPAFEPMKIEARVGGFDVTFSRPLADEGALGPERFALKHWYYVPTASYGGPKYDLQDLTVRDVRLSADRRVVSLDVDALEAGRVVYLHFDRDLRSDAGEALWVNEAWYTMNVLPGADSPTPRIAQTLPNTLSDEERAAGWRLLFDGVSFEGWKIYGAEDDAIEGWIVEDGALKFVRDVSLAGLVWNHVNPFSRAALDLMTQERFRDFELSIDWKISPGGNSGIFYRVPGESAALSWTFGLEMQVLDDARHRDGQIERRRSGDLYDLQSSNARAARAVGEWNTARIRVEGDHIEHWLNGHKKVDIERRSAAWDEAIAQSKFADTPGFGLAEEGHITLQDHGDIVWYRNIKLRSLDEPDRSANRSPPPAQ